MSRFCNFFNTLDHDNENVQFRFHICKFLALIKNTWLKQFLDTFLETSQMVFSASSQDQRRVGPHILQ